MRATPLASTAARTASFLAASFAMSASLLFACAGTKPSGDAKVPDPQTAGSDASAPMDLDAGPTTIVDAGVDAGWPGIDVTATVALAVEDRYVTPLLPAGAYTFAITGTGDADLYVKQTSKPTTVSYDCRPFLPGSNETCTITLAAPTVLFVMVRGAVTTSTYNLKGHP